MNFHPLPTRTIRRNTVVYLALTLMLMLVLWPLLLPAVIHGAHTIVKRDGTDSNFEQLIVSKS